MATTIAYQYMILSRATGEYLPERYASREEAEHARIVRFGCRSMAYEIIRQRVHWWKTNAR